MECAWVGIYVGRSYASFHTVLSPWRFGEGLQVCLDRCCPRLQLFEPVGFFAWLLYTREQMFGWKLPGPRERPDVLL